MKPRYRYPGVRPFETADSSLFFGRDRDCTDLLGLIALEKLVVLFGKSGYGKSSLINAAVIPALELQGRIAFSIRFGLQANGQVALSTILLNHMESDARIRPNPEMDFLDALCPEKTLWYQAKRRQGKDSRWVFFFDQFEEYFQQPAALRRHFEEQLAELLYTDVPQAVLNNALDCTDEEMGLLVQPLNMRVVFSIRADRLSELDGLKTRLPGILQKRFELAALNREQAREAIEKPAALRDGPFNSPPFKYKANTLESILTGLAGPKGGIEAFQLQILCDYIDNKVSGGLVSDRDENGFPDVTVEDLPDLEQVYGEYYTRRLDTLPGEMRLAARHILEEELIFEYEQTGEARRISLDKDLLLHKAAAHGATESLLHELESTFLLRREPNSLGGFNYEISHDTLLAPMVKAKRERLTTEREAAAEQEREAALERARKAEGEAKRESARRRRASILAAVAIVLFLVAAGFGLFAFNQREAALTAKLEAQKEKEAALTAETKAQMALEQKILAEEKKKTADIKSARSKASDILARAESLKAEYPDTYLQLQQDAKKILQEMLQQYPRDTTLKNALNNLNP
jgi:hypothetical protein